MTVRTFCMGKPSCEIRGTLVIIYIVLVKVIIDIGPLGIVVLRFTRTDL